MPRRARVVIAGCPHHVTQRGNRRQDVFFTDADRQRYLALLLEYSGTYGLAVEAYCLMANHVHLVAVPRTQAALAGALKPLHMRYAQHVNRAQGLSGRLWQGRFYSCPLDELHLWTAVRYVERNPVRAGLTARAEDWPWSSAGGHCGLRADPLTGDPCGLHQQVPPESWSAWLAEPWEEEELERLDRIRSGTFTGRPAGGQAFLDRLEALVGRLLRPRKRGRPPKAKDASG